MDMAHPGWSVVLRICVLLALCVGALCAPRGCDIDFHMESESLMMLPGGNASVLCDARCYAGDERVDVIWRNERGDVIDAIPNSVFAVKYNRGLMNRLMILGANPDLAGTYVCSVMRSGNLVKQRDIGVIVLGTAGSNYRFPVDSGPRRGDQTPREDLVHRPVRSVKARLQKLDASSSVSSSYVTEANRRDREKLPFMRGLLNRKVDIQQLPEARQSSSVSLGQFRPLDDMLNDGATFDNTGDTALKLNYKLLEIPGNTVDRNTEEFGFGHQTDVSHSDFDQEAMRLNSDEDMGYTEYMGSHVFYDSVLYGNDATKVEDETISRRTDFDLSDFERQDEIESDDGFELPYGTESFDTDPLYGEHGSKFPEFGSEEMRQVRKKDENNRKDAEREHDVMEMHHFRGKRQADASITTESIDTSTSTDDGDTSSATVQTTATTITTTTKKASSTTRPATDPGSTTGERQTISSFPATSAKPTTALSESSRADHSQKDESSETSTQGASQGDGGGQGGSDSANDQSDSATSDSQSDSCPGNTSFGKYGVMAFSISLALAFLLLYAILMILFMPRILERRRKNKTDPEGAIYRKKATGLEETAPLTLISDDTPVSDPEVETGKDTTIDLDKSMTSEGDKADESKKAAEAKETTAAVSTFLLRQTSQAKKDENDTKKEEKEGKDDKKDSDKKAPDSTPAVKDQSETSVTPAVTSDKQPETTNSESQKTATTPDGGKTSSEGDILSSLTPLMGSLSTGPGQSDTGKDQSQTSNGTTDKLESSSKDQSGAVKSKAEGSADGLPLPPPVTTEETNKGVDNVVDV